MKFCVVTHRNWKETGRSVPMEFEKAIKMVRKINRTNQDRTWDAERNMAYIEEASTVKHLPVNVQ